MDWQTICAFACLCRVVDGSLPPCLHGHRTDAYRFRQGAEARGLFLICSSILIPTIRPHPSFSPLLSLSWSPTITAPSCRCPDHLQRARRLEFPNSQLCTPGQGQHWSGRGWTEGRAVPREVQGLGGEPDQARVAADVLRHHGRGAQGGRVVRFACLNFASCCEGFSLPLHVVYALPAAVFTIQLKLLLAMRRSK